MRRLNFKILILFISILLLIFVFEYGLVSFDWVSITTYEKIIDFFNLVFKGEEPFTSSLKTRYSLIKAGWYMFTKNPIFGVGYANFAAYEADAKLALGLGLEKYFENFTHNSYIQILAEFGLIGIIWFFSFIFYIFKSGFANIRRAKNSQIRVIQIGALSAVCSNLVFIIFYGSWLYTLAFWLPIGLIAAISNVIREDGL